MAVNVFYSVKSQKNTVVRMMVEMIMIMMCMFRSNKEQLLNLMNQSISIFKSIKPFLTKLTTYKTVDFQIPVINWEQLNQEGNQTFTGSASSGGQLHLYNGGIKLFCSTQVRLIYNPRSLLYSI